MNAVGSCWQPTRRPSSAHRQQGGAKLRPSAAAARAVRPARWQRPGWHTPQRMVNPVAAAAAQQQEAPPPPPPLPAAPAAAAAASCAAQDADLSTALSLANIRQTLIRLEDTIIFSLIERAQFARNDAVYQPDAIPVPGLRPDGRRYSLFEYLLRETEQVHGRIRRYTSPDEYAFFPGDLPPLVLPPITYEQVLAPCALVNINASIMDMYLEHLLPEIAAPGDDHNYGSSAMNDVTVLQALSKRIHYGMFVAEAKFRKQTAEYSELIARQDADAIMELLTDRAVELRVIERVRLKAATFGQDLEVSGAAGGANGSGGSYKVRPEVVAQLYEQWVMPLTKEVEVQYLLRRLDGDGGAAGQQAQQQQQHGGGAAR
ncbi:hypothetical protein ABPG75_009125 [Micractinium tetrahymenae]